MNLDNVHTVNNFGLEIFTSLSQTHRNVLLSPVSLARVLSFVKVGATFESRVTRQLSRWPFPTRIPVVSIPNDVTATSATSAWLSGFIMQSFRDVARTHGLTVHTVSSNEHDMNKWARDSTHNVVSTILDQLPYGVASFFIDVAYCRVPRPTVFDHGLSFTTLFRSERARSVTMMCARGVSLRCATVVACGQGVQILELPCGTTGELAMVVAVPNCMGLLDGILKELSRKPLQTWNEWTESLRERVFDKVAIPRFRLEFGTISVREEIRTLGLSAPFETDAENPPLLGMSYDRSLFLGDILHKAVVEVSDKRMMGDWAMCDGLESNPVMPFDTPRLGSAEIIVDRPFMFMVHHVKSGLILFAGRVDDPAEQQARNPNNTGLG